MGCLVRLLMFDFFLTVNRETFMHYLDITYVAVEKSNLFCKVAWVYKLYPDS